MILAYKGLNENNFHSATASRSLELAEGDIDEDVQVACYFDSPQNHVNDNRC